VEATCQPGGEDFVDKDIKLLEEDPAYHLGLYHAERRWTLRHRAKGSSHCGGSSAAEYTTM